MRLRNVKNKNKLLDNCEQLIKNPEEYIGNWKQVFGNNNKIEIEIGMGKGDFIIAKALNNPNINYIGIEKYDSVLARATEKIPKDLKNLRLIRVDAINIDKIFNKEIDTIYLNFSDPWPKKRHALRRLTSSVFLDKYEHIFRKDKDIYQKTDNMNLFEYSLISYNYNGYLIKEISLDLHNSDIEKSELTEYEKKFMQYNKNIYYVHVKK